MSHVGNAGVEPGIPTAVDGDAAQLRTWYFDVNVTASDYYKKLNEGVPPLPTDSMIERPPAPSFTNELRASSPSSARSIEEECPTEFSHPAAVEEQPIIWLPKDPLGLVYVLARELASHHILYSLDGASMDSQGKVTVSFASPEDVRRPPIPRPCERERDEKGLFSFWDMISVFHKYEASFTR